jgi:hypothetical protein
VALAMIALARLDSLSTAGGWRRSMSDQIASTMPWAAVKAIVIRSRGARTWFSQA